MMSASYLKSDLTYVSAQLETILKTFLNYDTTETSTIKSNLKSTITFVDTPCQAIVNRFQYYETILGTYITLSDKSDQLTTYLKQLMLMCFYIFYKLVYIEKLGAML